MMTGAAILSSETIRDTQRCAATRQLLHDRFDRWLNLREDRMQEQTSTWRS